VPRHKVHCAVDRLALGRAYPDVHRWIDEPYRWLGPRHRILRHDLLSVTLRYGRDPRRLAAAVLHLALDGEL